MPFSLEGTAFFIEAIALGIFLYGWGKINRWVHFGSGIVVGISGVLSGILVVAANGWMNHPEGFELLREGGSILEGVKNVDPIDAMFNAAWFSQALHMTLAAFVATGFAVAGVHAIQLLRHPGSEFHRIALTIAMIFGSVAALLQPLSGDLSAKDVAKRQPAKLAAMEAHFETQERAPLLIGGIPNEETGKVKYGLHIPGVLSWLAFGDLDAEVQGLNDIPKEEHPPVLITHFAFQIMVGAGGMLMLLGLVFLWWRWRKRGSPYPAWLLRAMALATPLGFVAVEAGWTVTEVGRQPWIIYGHLKTADALTPMTGLVWSFAITTVVYLLLSLMVIWLMRRQIHSMNQKLADTTHSL